jgi:predicted ATPase
MRYKKFVIKNYRAATGPLEIPVDKGSLMPIIGINESGKTTILQAIFAFDHFNDDSNDRGRHLDDVSNLYRSSSPAATVEAEIEITRTELRRVFSECGKEAPTERTAYEELARRTKFSSRLIIRRTIPTRKYALVGDYFGNEGLQDAVAREIIRCLPYILYFDDFRDKIPEKIEIPQDEGKSSGEWFDIMEQLFACTDKSFSPRKLAKMEVRQRKTVLSQVQRRLNETLTRQWQNFRLDDREALEIQIEFDQEVLTPSAVQPPAPAAGPVATPAPLPTAQLVKHYIKLEVVESDRQGNKRFFFISNRSKGFYWFFNFVMKLEFNPKVTDDQQHSIYLLDEPGSYLHAQAQRKLCEKLRQISGTNHVIYCTHSHYLLDPEVIPINSVMVSDKDENSNIQLTRMIDYREKSDARWSALQPLLDALQVRPYALDLGHSQTTVITEGIYDYYCLELFRGGRAISILPCLAARGASADS